jgi:hypothetical protein
MIYQNMDGYMHPRAPTPHPPTPQPQPDQWLRPDSPTYHALKGNSELEKSAGFTWGTSVPAGRMEMTPEQAAATTLFKHNIDSYDPTGLLRSMGEFGQSFRPEAGGVSANADIHYMVGGAMFLPPASFRPETSQMMHSHPQDPAHVNNYPSDADYYHAYFATKGNTGNLKGETIYHPGSGKFYWYEPKLEPGAGYPKFYELVNPYEEGPRSGSLESHRPLPDTSTYGEHLIDWHGGQRPPSA